MFGYKPVNRKGFIGLAIMIIIAILIMSLFLIITFFPSLTKLIGIKSDAKLFIEIDDEGSMIAGLLHAKDYNISYAEIIGDLRADNYKDVIGDGVKSLEATLNKLNINLTVYESENVIYGTDSDNKVMDIALPGGIRGEVGLA